MKRSLYIKPAFIKVGKTNINMKILHFITVISSSIQILATALSFLLLVVTVPKYKNISLKFFS